MITDEFIKRLEGEKKPQRLERAALMVAAAKDLGFAGAHIGGFGLAYKDFMTIRERASAIGKDWRGRMEELVFARPERVLPLAESGDGLSDGMASYQVTRMKPQPLVAFSACRRRSTSTSSRDGSLGARLFGSQFKAEPSTPRTIPGGMASGTSCWSLRPLPQGNAGLRDLR